MFVKGFIFKAQYLICYLFGQMTKKVLGAKGLMRNAIYYSRRVVEWLFFMSTIYSFSIKTSCKLDAKCEAEKEP